jgi:hypothetical protein
VGIAIGGDRRRAVGIAIGGSIASRDRRWMRARDIRFRSSGRPIRLDNP